MTAPVLVWLRRDLRLADNPASTVAVASGSSVIPVFIWSPEEEAPWAPGSASRWWLHQSLEQFDASLRQRGSKLTILRGPSAETLLKLADETGARSIFWNRLYDPQSVPRDRQVKTLLRNRGLEAESFPGNLLFEPWTIQPYRVFTAFWKACLRAAAPANPIDPPQEIPSPRRFPESLPLSALDLEPEVDWAAGLRETWQPGESQAAEQLKTFIAGPIESYSTDRDRPDHIGTSRLSPHLHFGEISPRQIWHAARSDDFMRQLVWREFAHHVLFHYPHTPNQPLRPEFARFPYRMDEAGLKAWTQGRTGYPLVDAGMRELWHTGWMHNRVRMVAASFLVKHLLIPWQEGAAWFWDTLVDADLANNTLGWQWVAGCGADAAPYFRIFNPALQAKRFDPNGDYIRRWAPDSLNLKPIVDHEAARKHALAAIAALKGNPR